MTACHFSGSDMGCGRKGERHGGSRAEIGSSRGNSEFRGLRPRAARAHWEQWVARAAGQTEDEVGETQRSQGPEVVRPGLLLTCCAGLPSAFRGPLYCSVAIAFVLVTLQETEHSVGRCCVLFACQYVPSAQLV